MKKPYLVFMYDLPLVPLSKNPNPQPVEIKEFDSEHEAITFAESQRGNWYRVAVRKTGAGEVIVDFQQRIATRSCQ